MSQQQQARALFVLPRIKNHHAIPAVFARARILGVDINRAAKFFLSGREVQSVQALKVLTSRILAHGNYIEGPVRPGRGIDHGRGGNADFGVNLAAVASVRSGFTGLEH